MVEEVSTINRGDSVVRQRNPPTATSMVGSNRQAEKLLAKGKSLLKRKRFEEATKALRDAMKCEPNNPKMMRAYAEALSQSNNHHKAIEYFEQAEALEPSDGSRQRDYAKSLSMKASELGRAGEYAVALPLYEKALSLDPKGLDILQNYAKTVQGLAQELSDRGCHHEAMTVLAKALEYKPNDHRLRTACANAAAAAGDVEFACELFEQCLVQRGDDILTLTSYGNALAAAGAYEEAYDRFEQSLALDGNHVPTLNSYGHALAAAGAYEEAYDRFEQSLALDGNNVVALTSYGHALAAAGAYEDAYDRFEQSLELDGNHVPTLTSYGNALAAAGAYKDAYDRFEQSLALDGKHVPTLTSYGNALAAAGAYEEAHDRFEQSLELDGKHVPTLTSYGNALAAAGAYEEAYDRFEQSLALDENNVVTRFTYAQWLEHQGDYAAAAAQLEPVDLAYLPTDRATVIRLYLGRLYYYLKQPDTGKAYFDLAIEQSNDRDRSILYAAQSRLLTDPYSDEAIQLLQQLEQSSPFYHRALNAIALNANPEAFYNSFYRKKLDIQRTEMIYRSIYHTIINEVAILKSIAYRIFYSQNHDCPAIAGIIQELEDLHKNIREQRAAEKDTLAKIPHGDYRAILRTIAEVAHNISDDVNNELLVISSKLERLSRSDLFSTETHKEHLGQLSRQLRITQDVLKKLKSIGKGIPVKPKRFPVTNLFERWSLGKDKNFVRLNEAKIYLRVQNADSEIAGDEEQIKSMINELIENAISHNPNHPNLTIRIRSQDVVNPPELTSPNIPGERHYLKITVQDNGKGIPQAKKNWIFQPLNTTKDSQQGGGLGLYIIRQSMQQMKGFIQETGKVGKGACFNLYLPHSDK